MDGDQHTGADGKPISSIASGASGVAGGLAGGWAKGSAGVSHLWAKAGVAADRAATRARDSASRLRSALPETLAFLSQAELLKWSERITEGAASAYDKALDAAYLKTHIGGGNHRMFDGGHDLAGAFAAAREALPDDTFVQESVGYMSAIWKDATTAKGLPFFTWTQDAYGDCAQWMAAHIPGADKAWFYDLCSYDAFEVLGATLPIVGAVFALRSEDKAQVAEILGASGFAAVAAANPLAGIAMVCVAAYAYAVKKQEFDGRRFAKGAGVAGLSFALFAVLGFPLLIELVIVLVATHLVRHRLPDAAVVQEIMTSRVSPALAQVKATAAEWHASLPQWPWLNDEQTAG